MANMEKIPGCKLNVAVYKSIGNPPSLPLMHISRKWLLNDFMGSTLGCDLQVANTESYTTSRNTSSFDNGT